MTGGRYLLDSNVLVWLDSGNGRLNPQLLERLRRADQRYLSAVTGWELNLKQAEGKLRLRTPVGAMLGHFRLQELPVSIHHGDRAALLPVELRDPFNRMLVAQALVEGLVLVTGDEELARYGVPILLV